MSYYDILNVAPNASAEEIKIAHRKQAVKWHPDNNPSEEATKRMQQINEAYDVLSNPVKRLEYDNSNKRKKSSDNLSYRKKREKADSIYDQYADYVVKTEVYKKRFDAATIKHFKELINSWLQELSKEKINDQMISDVFFNIVKYIDLDDCRLSLTLSSYTRGKTLFKLYITEFKTIVESHVDEKVVVEFLTKKISEYIYESEKESFLSYNLKTRKTTDGILNLLLIHLGMVIEGSTKPIQILDALLSKLEDMIKSQYHDEFIFINRKAVNQFVRLITEWLDTIYNTDNALDILKCLKGKYNELDSASDWIINFGFNDEIKKYISDFFAHILEKSNKRTRENTI